MTKEDLNIGDKIRHKFRNNKYQNCTIIEIEKGCNGGIIAVCEDGFYGYKDESRFNLQDIELVCEKVILDLFK